jgi:ligand-binding SRPBCC domain-containing protein
MTFEQTTVIRAPLAQVFTFFSAPQNLARLTPPKMRFRITNGPGRALREGDLIDYEIRILGIPLHWRTRVTAWRENEMFADVQERGPYRKWLHTHTFREVAAGVEMHDRVEYEVPLGWLGQLAAGWWVTREVQAIFAYREQAIAQIFA